jgi:hypothetical protein
MATVRDVSLSIFNEPNGQVRVQVSWNIDGGGHDLEQNATYRELVELIGVDRPLGEATTPDQAIYTLEDGLVSFGATNLAHQERSTEKLIEAGILNEDTHPFMPRNDEIQARVQLMAASQSAVIVREEISPVTG